MQQGSRCRCRHGSDGAGLCATIASADNETLYISEVYLSYGKDAESAKKWLTDNGYTVLEQDLNEDTQGGISWTKLSSEKRSVYLGFKTTTNSDDAIRDMRVMNMNGEYSYDEYEKVLENKKAEINSFIADIKTALAEYRANYKYGDVKSKIAHDRMNLLLDDDCENAPLGDLLLKPIKEEMSKQEYNKVPTKHADLTTIIMQGNIESVNALMNCLSMASDNSYIKFVGYGASLALLGAGIGSLVYGSKAEGIKQVVTRTKEANNTIANKEKIVSDKIAKYLSDNKITKVDLLDVGNNTSNLTIYKHLEISKNNSMIPVSLTKNREEINENALEILNEIEYSDPGFAKALEEYNAAKDNPANKKPIIKETGSVVGTGTMALSCVGSAAVGAVIAFFLVRKKKGDNIAV